MTYKHMKISTTYISYSNAENQLLRDFNLYKSGATYIFLIAYLYPTATNNTYSYILKRTGLKLFPNVNMHNYSLVTHSQASHIII